MQQQNVDLAYPTGECYCGCGTKIPRTRFFVATHDRKAESMLIKMRYGGIADFVAQHGYGPGRKNLTDEFADFDRQERRDA